jgi:hypothetical protein
MPERFVATHAAKHQHSWWAAEGKNSATGNFVACLLITVMMLFTFENMPINLLQRINLFL